jgi:hypothetical protein
MASFDTVNNPGFAPANTEDKLHGFPNPNTSFLGNSRQTYGNHVGFAPITHPTYEFRVNQYGQKAAGYFAPACKFLNVVNAKMSAGRKCLITGNNLVSTGTVAAAITNGGSYIFSNCAFYNNDSVNNWNFVSAAAGQDISINVVGNNYIRMTKFVNSAATFVAAAVTGSISISGRGNIIYDQAYSTLGYIYYVSLSSASTNTFKDVSFIHRVKDITTAQAQMFVVTGTAATNLVFDNINIDYATSNTAGYSYVISSASTLATITGNINKLYVSSPGGSGSQIFLQSSTSTINLKVNDIRIIHPAAAIVLVSQTGSGNVTLDIKSLYIIISGTTNLITNNTGTGVLNLTIGSLYVDNTASSIRLFTGGPAVTTTTTNITIENLYLKQTASIMYFGNEFREGFLTIKNATLDLTGGATLRMNASTNSTTTQYRIKDLNIIGNTAINYLNPTANGARIIVGSITQSAAGSMRWFDSCSNAKVFIGDGSLTTSTTPTYWIYLGGTALTAYDWILNKLGITSSSTNNNMVYVGSATTSPNILYSNGGTLFSRNLTAGTCYIGGVNGCTDSWRVSNRRIICYNTTNKTVYFSGGATAGTPTLLAQDCTFHSIPSAVTFNVAGAGCTPSMTGTGVVRHSGTITAGISSTGFTQDTKLEIKTFTLSAPPTATLASTGHAFVNGDRVLLFASTTCPTNNADGSSLELLGHNLAVVLHSHFNGTNASTTFVDESYRGTTPTAKTFTAVGNAQLSTAQAKFGSASLLLDGTGDCATVPDHTDFDFADKEYTIDTWIYPTSFTDAGIYSKRTDTTYSKSVSLETTSGGAIKCIAHQGYQWRPPTFPSNPTPDANTIYVSTTGNDITGDGTSGNPYATIGKGQTISTSGKLVWVVAGTYTISSSFFKAGVNWFFEDGCTVSAGANQIYFVNSVSSTTVWGRAVFTSTLNDANALVDNNAATTTNFYCRSMTASNNAQVCKSRVASGTLNVYMLEDVTASSATSHTMRSANSGAILNFHVRDIKSDGDTAVIVAESGTISGTFRNTYGNISASAAVVRCFSADANLTLSGEKIWPGTASAVKDTSLGVLVEGAASGTAVQATITGCDIMGSSTAYGTLSIGYAAVVPTVTLNNCRVRCKAAQTGTVITRYTGASAVNLVFGSMCYLSGTFTTANFTITNSTNYKTTAPFVDVQSEGTNLTMTGGSLTLNAWNHVAFMRREDTYRLYLNGIQVATTAALGGANTNTAAVAIGATAADGSGSFTGYIDELRVIKGVGHADYTEDTFVVPAAAYDSALYVVNKNTNDLQVSYTAGGSAITLAAGSGTYYITGA